MRLANITRAAFLAVTFGLLSQQVLADAKPSIAGLKAGPITIDASIIRNFARTPPAEQALSSSKLTFRGGLVLSSPSPNFGAAGPASSSATMQDRCSRFPIPVSG